MNLPGILSTARFSQVGFVCNDIEETKKKFALLFGIEPVPTQECGEYSITKTEVFGKPAPDANSVLAFMDLTPGVQLELIQPNEAPSVWRDWITEHGEGIHHIAFGVDDADETAKELIDKFGAVIEQRGIYGDGSGQYIYLDCLKELKCRIELLQSFRN